MADLQVQLCPYCGRSIYGIGALRMHMKACKRTMCQNCEHKDTCKCTEWMIKCPYKDEF